jgi:hypothetical protein
LQANIGVAPRFRQPSSSATMGAPIRRDQMAKGQAKSNKEAKKPKKEVKKTIAANPSTKGKVITD